MPSPSPSAPASAPADAARALADSMLRTGRADPARFSASFLSQVSTAQVDAILAQIEKTLGEYRRIDGTAGKYTAHFENGTVEVMVHLDAQGDVDGLFFKAPKLQAASLDDALRGLQPATGTLSYVILENGSEMAARDASAPLAVGSAFKLAVLAALRDQISRGRMHWTDVAALQPRWKSLPTGVLRTWPDGTPITLATYAAEMISISDNTAADALVRLVGPSALAPYAMRNVPFLTTREIFELKSAPGAAHRAVYLAAATASQRAAVLQTIDAMPLPALDALETKPILAAEWHYSVRELCGLMRKVADLPLMSINPGVADASAFRHVAYKGGSDLGVLNMTTEVTTKRGTTFCFSATVNDPVKSVDESAAILAYGSVLNFLAAR
jgi:beta-lactamase class A